MATHRFFMVLVLSLGPLPRFRWTASDRKYAVREMPPRTAEAEQNSRGRSPNSSIFSVRAQLLERALPEQDPRSDPRSTKCRPVRPRTRSQGVMQKSTCEKRFFMVLVSSLGPLPRFR